MFSLPAYSLTVGNVYTIQLTVTSPDGQGSYITGYSKVTVRVVSGAIVAVINGGNKFLISSDTILDASSSYDSDNVDSVSSLTYLWSCTSLSLAYYGQSCDATVFNGLSMNASTIKIRPVYLNASTSYEIGVLVTHTEDGRFDTASATVSALSGYANLGMVAISSSSSQTINEDQQLSVEAVVSSNVSLIATWTALVDVTSVDLPTTLGPIFRNYTRPMSNIPFNLIIPGSTFLSGSTVTLRLALATSDSIVISYAEMTIKINTSPSGGSIVASPQNGTALDTYFEFTTSSWVVDESALPLTYTYQYQLSDNSPVLTIKVRSQSNILSTMLPPGSESESYAVVVSVIAYDANLAKGYTQQTSYVTPQTTSTNYSALLESMLANPNTLSDPDQTLNILNVIGSTMNAVNCTAATPAYCAGLNRYGCVETPNTCGSCLMNYTGVYGDSNTLCVPYNSQETLKAAGENCTSSTECIYGVCKNNTCIVPLQTCPTVDGMTCSGQGECKHKIDGNYVPASECTVTTTACVASCSCYDGFGGVDCGLNSTDLAIRETSRITLCTTLSNVLSTSDYSSELLETLAGTLLNSFSPYEVSSDAGFDICLNATTQLLALAESGYLDVTSSTTTTSLLSLISSFATKSTGFGIASVDSSTESLVSSVMSAMITGQSGIEYSTSNLKVTISRTAVDDLADANITSPVSSAEAAYGKTGTQIMLVGNASQYCDDGSGFASLSVGTWGSNPYADESKRFGSNLMRFQSSSVGTIAYYDVIAVDDDDNNSTTIICNETLSSDGNSTITVNCTTVISTVNATIITDTNSTRHLTTINALVNVTTTPAYYIRYPFTQSQTFGSNDLNYSIPECSTYNEYNEAVTCKSCNVSTYDNVSITFACYDITQLCGGVAKTVPVTTAASRRRSLQGRSLQGRSLQGTTDDDSATKLSIAQIGALLKDLQRDFASVLSSNPFRINIEKAKGIVAFVGCLVVVFIVGIIYFRSWDHFDRSQIIYVERHKFATEIPDMNTPYKMKKGISSTALAFYEHEQDYDRVSHRASRRLQRGLSRHKTVKLNNRLVAQLLDAAIPLEKLDPTSENWFRRQFKALMDHHEYIYMIGGSSLIETRLIRWMNVTSNILVMLFLDTLFFGVFFPDSGTCEGYFSFDLCTTPINSATSANLCKWTGSDNNQEIGAYCELNPPPEGVAFTMLLSTLSLLLLIPLTVSFDIIRLTICAKRPDLESIGLSAEFWLGLNYHGLKYDDNKRDESQSAELFSPRSQSLRKEMSIRQKSAVSLAANTAAAALNHGLMESADKSYVVDAFFDQLVARTAFADSASIQTEVEFLIQDIRDFFSAGANQQPQATTRTYTVNRVQAKTLAIQKYLGLNIDGTVTNTSYISSFFLLGSGPKHRLENRLLAIRKRANRIEEKLLNAATGGSMEPEISLLQHFVLEQFPAYKRFTLRYHFFDFPNSNASMINPYIWVAGWFYMIATQLFFIYWIFAWCVSQGGKTFTGWGNNEILNIVQDIFLVQVMQVYVIYIGTIATIVPQLRSIYCRLYEVALKTDTLKASGVLDELRVVQYLSPSCRAARKSKVSKLRAANILRCLDDIDVQYCRQLDRKSLGFWAILAIALPGLLSYFGQSLGDVVFKAIFPSTLSAVVLIFWWLYNVSVILCFVLLVALIIMVVSTRGKILQTCCQRITMMCKSKKQRAKATRKPRRLHSTQYKRISSDVHAVQLKKRWQRRLHELYLAFIARWQAKENRINKHWLHMNLPPIDRIDSNFNKQELQLQMLRISTNARLAHEEEEGEGGEEGYASSNPYSSPNKAVSSSAFSSSPSPFKATASVLLSDDIREFRSVLMNLVADELHAADRRFAVIKMKNTYEQLPEQIKAEHNTVWHSLWDEELKHKNKHRNDLSTKLAVKLGLLPSESGDDAEQLKQHHLTDTTDGGFVMNKQRSSLRQYAFMESFSAKRQQRQQQEAEEAEAGEGMMTLSSNSIKRFDEAPPVEFNALLPVSKTTTEQQQSMSSAGRVKSIRFNLPQSEDNTQQVTPLRVEDAAAVLLREEEEDPIVTRHGIESADEKEDEKANEDVTIHIADVFGQDEEADIIAEGNDHNQSSSPLGALLVEGGIHHFHQPANAAAILPQTVGDEGTNVDDSNNVNAETAASADSTAAAASPKQVAVQATAPSRDVAAVDFFSSSMNYSHDDDEEEDA